MKESFLIILFSLCLIAQEKSKKFYLRYKIINDEKNIISYFQDVKNYHQKKANEKTKQEELNRIVEQLAKKHNYFVGSNYVTISQQANLYLLKGKKKEFIRQLNSIQQIQDLQKKLFQNSILQRKINKEKIKEKIIELSTELTKNRQYVKNKYDVLSKNVYQLITTKLIIYLICDYDDLKKIGIYQNQKKTKTTDATFN